MTKSAPTGAELAEQLIAAAGDGLVAVDESASVIIFNPAAGLIFGVDPQQMLGNSLKPLFPPGIFETHQNYIKDFLSGKQPRGIVGSTIEVDGWHSEGRTVPLELTLTATAVRGQKILIAAIRDISVRLKASRRNQELLQQLTQAQKMEALGNLTAGIAHDFNTNLQTILGYASILDNELDPAHRHSQDIHQILTATHQAKRLTKKLLNFSRKTSGRFEVLSLSRVVSDVVGLLERTFPANIRIRTRLAPLLFLEGDAIWLQHALMNICINARDAMPDGGTLSFSASRVSLSPQEAEELELSPGPYCLLIAKDTGAGMTPEVMAHVFDPFYSTKPRGKGSGLGLSMLKTTVKRHKGKVVLSSDPGQGTRFSIYLPATETRPRPTRHTPVEELLPHGSGETILLVDDLEHLRQMAQRLLSGLGYKTLLAANGEEALQVFRQHGDRISLVILDVMLPGMSSAETLEQMRRLDPQVKVLASSGYRRQDQPQDLEELGAIGFLQKPYSIAKISQVIFKVLNP